MSEEKKWWFNTRTKQTEFGLKSNSLYRIGPFDTESEAKNAESLVRERSKEWERSEAEED
ncbi:MAG: SPOR domain-containing protein [Actinomycetota bacterium]